MSLVFDQIHFLLTHLNPSCMCNQNLKWVTEILAQSAKTNLRGK